MSTIKVTPDQLQQVSNQFTQAGQWAQQMNSTLDHQMMMESLWYGLTRERFYQNHRMAKGCMEAFVTLVYSISQELARHAECFKAADMQEVKPVPELCRAPEDDRNMLEKSKDSLYELGTGIIWLLQNEMRRSSILLGLFWTIYHSAFQNRS